MRNPWGGSEWTGAWSDKSDKWQLLEEEKVKKLRGRVCDDGVFWMCFNDFWKKCREVCVVKFRMPSNRGQLSNFTKSSKKKKKE